MKIFKFIIIAFHCFLILSLKPILAQQCYNQLCFNTNYKFKINNSKTDKLKTIFFCGGGITLLTSKNNYYPPTNNIGYNVGIGYLFPFDTNKSFKLDFAYIR